MTEGNGVWGTVGWNRPTILDAENTAQAVDHLTTYFSRVKKSGIPKYTGAEYNSIGKHAAAASPDVFTSDDIVAVGTLSVSIRQEHIVQLLGAASTPDGQAAVAQWRGRSKVPSAKKVPIDVVEVSRLFAELPTDVDLAEATDGHLETADLLWKEVRRKHMGPTRVSKLLARKRPRLLPVIDSAVCAQLGHRRRADFNASLRTVLRDEDLNLPEHLGKLRSKAVELSGGDQRIADLSDLRVFDIVLWMEEKHPTVPSS